MTYKIKQIYNSFLKAKEDPSSASKIETLRLHIFNLALLIESIVLLTNIVRHLIKGDYKSALSVFVLLCVLQFLLFTQKLTNSTKYLVLLIVGYVFVLVFNHFVESTKDVIQTYYIVFFVCAIFFGGKKFYWALALAVVLYYFSFFWLGYHKMFNFLGGLPFVFLAFVIRVFLREAEKNERIISKQVEELKEVDSLKNRLFANVSHEIRTPLTLILGANENLENAKAPKKYTESIKNNSNRLLELINQILELAKAENKRKTIEISKIDFGTYVRSYVASFTNLSESKNIRFQNQIDANLKIIYTDVDAFSKIIYNLLGNAFKFSSVGDTVFFEATLINKNNVQLKVTDTGRGISEEELPYIFNQYFHSKVGFEASSGIGLALVNELVHSLGGTIEVTSKKNVGSCFTVTLPITLECLKERKVNYSVIESSKKEMEEQLFDIEVQEDNEELEVVFENDKKVLLLVEDNDELREYIKEVIADEFNVIEAVDGKMGIEKAIEFTPDIILSDVMMPKVDGLELLQQLKKDIRTSHIPIIILTAKTNEADKLRGLEYEADDYLTKPFNQTELLLRLKNRIAAQIKTQKRIEAFSIHNLKNTELPSIEDKFLQSIKQQIENHLSDESFGPDELASVIGLSKSQLLRKIRAVTNTTTSIYMRNIRLEFAKEKLINKTATISEIAYETGFSSPNYFSKCFKEYTNQTPKEFLENF
jgi:signal transduction histidine kinase/DNA-binding response OmpR family regulator